jgi:hypothetical protein
VLVLGESDHAGADVAGRRHVQVFAKTTGGAAVVRDGDDGSEIADEAGEIFGNGLSGGWWGGIALEATEQGGETGASADGDDADARGLGGGRHCDSV